MSKTSRKAGRARRVMLLSFFTLISLVRSQLYLAPSPLLPTIMDELGLDYAMGGQILFIVTVLMGLFLFIGSAVIDRVGSAPTLVLAFLFLTVDGVTASLAGDYALLMLGRVCTGIGMGLSIAAMPALVSQHFAPGVQVYVNSYNNAFGALSMALTYSFTVPLYRVFGSWRGVLLLWSMLALAGAAGFGLFYTRLRTKRTARTSTPDANPLDAKHDSSLRQAARLPVVRMLTLATVGALWVFTIYSSYLPSFLTEYRGLSLDQAGAQTALIQYGGVAGCLLWGFLGGRIKRRMVFVAGPLVGMLAGAAGVALLPAGAGLSACIFLLGMAYYAYTIAAMTTLMRSPDITPAVVAGGTALYLGSGSVLALSAPSVFDILQRLMGMQLTLLCFCLLLLGSLLCTLLSRRKYDPE